MGRVTDDSVCFITANCQNQRGEEEEEAENENRIASVALLSQQNRRRLREEKTRMRESFLVPLACVCVSM